MGFRAIGRISGKSNGTVLKWIRGMGKKIHDLSPEQPCKVMEMDEMWTLNINSKKKMSGYDPPQYFWRNIEGPRDCCGSTSKTIPRFCLWIKRDKNRSKTLGKGRASCERCGDDGFVEILWILFCSHRNLPSGQRWNMDDGRLQHAMSSLSGKTSKKNSVFQQEFRDVGNLLKAVVSQVQWKSIEHEKVMLPDYRLFSVIRIQVACPAGVRPFARSNKLPQGNFDHPLFGPPFSLGSKGLSRSQGHLWSFFWS